MAYQAWVTNAQTVLRRQQQERAQQEQAGQLPTGELGHVWLLGGMQGRKALTSTPVPRRWPRPGGGAGGGP